MFTEYPLSHVSAVARLAVAQAFWAHAAVRARLAVERVLRELPFRVGHDVEHLERVLARPRCGGKQRLDVIHLEAVLEAMADHPFLISSPDMARQVAAFRIRLLELA